MDGPLSVVKLYADNHQTALEFSDGTIAFYEAGGSGGLDGLRSFQLHRAGKLIFFANVEIAYNPEERSHRVLRIRTGLTQEQAAIYWNAAVTHIQEALKAEPKVPDHRTLVLAEEHVIRNGRYDREDLAQGKMEYLPEYEE